MKRLRVGFDEAALASLERAAIASGRTRSDLVRLALSEFLARAEKGQRESEERAQWEGKYDRVNRQARALFAEQARLR